MGKIQPTSSRGRLITICGIDGSGKSTLAENLCKALQQQGYRTIVLKPLKIDNDLVTNLKNLRTQIPSTEIVCHKKINDGIGEALTFAFIHNVLIKVSPALLNHDYVICDRYFVSHQINQSYFGLNFKSFEPFWNLLPKPDLMFLLDLPFTDALARLDLRGNRHGLETADFLKVTQQLFLNYASIYNMKVLSGMETTDIIANLALKEVSVL